MDSALGDRGDGAPGTARSGDPGHRPAEIIALLGRGTHFEGKLFFEGRVRIDGSFKGEIRGEDVLVIGEGAKVVGEVHVSTCIVTGGEVEANVRARDAIELYAPSRVVGALHSPAIFIDRGVKFEGSCKMAPLEEDPSSTFGTSDPQAVLRPEPSAVRAPRIEEPAPVTPRAGAAPPGDER